MTPEDKMKAIVETAGECWSIDPTEQHPLHKAVCGPRNPSPTDLNELFRLAGKLDVVCYVKLDPPGLGYSGFARPIGSIVVGDFVADSPSVALLDALYNSINVK